jgi:bifunctional NMN adenylyltransferase/nudix hydrolase
MPNQTSTGIIIGRFQVLELNEIHQKLIAQVQEKHPRVVVFLSSNPAPSDRNPLDWAFRWKMFEEQYGETIEVLEMPDLPDDRIWSQELDRRILEQKIGSNVTLYGTAEDFVSRYSGRHTTEVLEAQEEDFEQESSVETAVNFRDFRAGVLYGIYSHFPTVYPTVDIAVFRSERREILLARKPNETKYRLPGGFTDPEDESYEDAAVRELGEECGEITIDELTYLGSARIDDWRYHGSRDSVMTHLYACILSEGEPTANDDIAELKWFDTNKLTSDHFVPEHRVLWEILKEYVEEV